MIDHKRTSTIVAAAEYLGVSYGMVQYALREGFIFRDADGNINEESLVKYKKLRSMEGRTRLRKLVVKHSSAAIMTTSCGYPCTLTAAVSSAPRVRPSRQRGYLVAK